MLNSFYCEVSSNAVMFYSMTFSIFTLFSNYVWGLHNNLSVTCLKGKENPKNQVFIDKRPFKTFQ